MRRSHRLWLVLAAGSALALPMQASAHSVSTSLVPTLPRDQSFEQESEPADVTESFIEFLNYIGAPAEKGAISDARVRAAQALSEHPGSPGALVTIEQRGEVGPMADHYTDLAGVGTLQEALASAAEGTVTLPRDGDVFDRFAIYALRDGSFTTLSADELDKGERFAGLSAVQQRSLLAEDDQYAAQAAEAVRVQDAQNAQALAAQHEADVQQRQETEHRHGRMQEIRAEGESASASDRKEYTDDIDTAERLHANDTAHPIPDDDRGYDHKSSGPEPTAHEVAMNPGPFMQQLIEDEKREHDLILHQTKALGTGGLR